MNRKRIVTAVLLAFVMASLSFLAFREFRTGAPIAMSDAVAMEKKTPAGEAAATAGKQKGHQVIAYYFHTTFRCSTCYTIEQLTKEAIQSGFADELKNGQLVWKLINVEEEGNDHFVKDYQLFTKSVVLVEMKDGAQVRWKNLKDVWKHVDKKDVFTKYIKDETRAFLGKS